LATHAQRAGDQTGVIDEDIIGPSMGHLFIHHPYLGMKVVSTLRVDLLAESIIECIIANLHKMILSTDSMR